MTEDRQIPMIQANGLRKEYGATQAVKEISFEVSRGEVVGFLGPNGAGKTTTMKMLTGFLKPSAGTARIGGIDVGVDALAAQSRLGYLPENAPLYDDMMVVDFLRYIAKLRGVDGPEHKSRLEKVCDHCGLLKVLGKDLGQLSKGYRQRVGLAQALLHDPDLLILDEPTSGLDPNQIVEIRDLIRELGREKTILLSTHILPEVQATCDRILIVNEGRLVADDTPDALTGSQAGAVIRLIVKNKIGVRHEPENLRQLFADVSGVANVELRDGEGAGTWGFTLRAQGANDPREAVFGAAVANDLVLLDMHRERVSLEDTFRRLTSGEHTQATTGENHV